MSAKKERGARETRKQDGKRRARRGTKRSPSARARKRRRSSKRGLASLPEALRNSLNDAIVDNRIDAELLLEVAAGDEPNADPAQVARIEEALAADGISVTDLGGERESASKPLAASQDPLQIYIRDVSRIPLLTHAEEKKYGKIVLESRQKIARILEKAGMSAAELRRYHPDPAIAGEEPPPRIPGRRKKDLVPLARRLVKEEHKFAEAQRRLIESNLRLVISIARRYTSHGLHLLDLINEGNLGLIRAIERFDYRMGYKFSTYASWWIRQAVRRAIADQGRLIRVPVHMADSINRWIRVSRKISQRLGREPTLREMAEELDISEPRLLEIMKVAQEPSSLEAPLASAQESSLADLVEDTSAVSPYRTVLSLAFSEHLQKMLSTLNEKERRILQLRFGLNGSPEHTLEEVGQMMGITRERVRQIESRAFKKLRHSRLAAELFSMLTEMRNEA
ncbi:MAG: RNA polymerase sigma factor RpoD/SigA [Candidatus Hydrogenedentota bacterium]|nr:MAG: RNA polymerase sigma factor RpoD/SigA [Candidatus Hydrogenedentota bacterium]